MQIFTYVNQEGDDNILRIGSKFNPSFVKSYGQFGESGYDCCWTPSKWARDLPPKNCSKWTHGLILQGKEEGKSLINKTCCNFDCDTPVSSRLAPNRGQQSHSSPSHFAHYFVLWSTSNAHWSARIRSRFSSLLQTSIFWLSPNS